MSSNNKFAGIDYISDEEIFFPVLNIDELDKFYGDDILVRIKISKMTKSGIMKKVANVSDLMELISSDVANKTFLEVVAVGDKVEDIKVGDNVNLGQITAKATYTESVTPMVYNVLLLYSEYNVTFKRKKIDVVED